MPGFFYSSTCLRFFLTKRSYSPLFIWSRINILLFIVAETLWLLRVLRAAKFSQLKARELITRFLTMKAAVPAWLQENDFTRPEVQLLYKTGYVKLCYRSHKRCTGDIKVYTRLLVMIAYPFVRFFTSFKIYINIIKIPLNVKSVACMQRYTKYKKTLFLYL